MTSAAAEPRPRLRAARGQVHSEVLGLDLVVEGDSLRFYDPATGERLRTHREAERRQEAAARRQEAAARMTAEQKARQETAAR